MLCIQQMQYNTMLFVLGLLIPLPLDELQVLVILQLVSVLRLICSPHLLGKILVVILVGSCSFSCYYYSVLLYLIFSTKCCFFIVVLPLLAQQQKLELESFCVKLF